MALPIKESAIDDVGRRASLRVVSSDRNNGRSFTIGGIGIVPRKSLLAIGLIACPAANRVGQAPLCDGCFDHDPRARRRIHTSHDQGHVKSSVVHCKLMPKHFLFAQVRPVIGGHHGDRGLLF